MDILKRFLLLLLALLLSGCELLREPTPLEFADEQVLVASMLEAGSPTVSVLLVRLARISASPRLQPSDVVRPISGATVLIFSGTDTVQLRENAPDVRKCLAASFTPEETPSGPGCYGAFLPGGVRAGEPYGLLIRLPGGGEVRGEAVVPDSLAILRPEAHTRFEVPLRAPEGGGGPRITVQWGEGGRAANLKITFEELRVFEQGERVRNSHCDLPMIAWTDPLWTDSVSLPVNQPSCHEVVRVGSQTYLSRAIHWDSIQAYLGVSAYDSAYTRYHSLQPNPAMEYRDVAVGVTGAIGLFAANAMSRQPIVLIARREADP